MSCCRYWPVSRSRAELTRTWSGRSCQSCCPRTGISVTRRWNGRAVRARARSIGSDKLCLEQRADAALHGRAMLLMAVVAPPDGVKEVGSDDHLEFTRRIKGLEVGWGPPGAEV